MITPFYGEFLRNVIPLEMSLHPCSYHCAYCFARLNNRRGRVADISPQALFNQLAHFRDRQTLENILLQQGFPVLISNKTDPFAPSNAAIILPILEVLTAQQIPVFIQTRGGDLVTEAVSILPPSGWYISITGTPGRIPPGVEPGCPSIESRYALLERLHAAGHFVTVGVNPYHPAWIADDEAFLTALWQRGVRHLWIELLHLNPHQKRNLTPADATALTPELIATLLARTEHPRRHERLLQFRTFARDMGFEVYADDEGGITHYFDAYHAYYPKLFPTMGAFITRELEAGRQPERPITFAEFWNSVKDVMPSGVFAHMLCYLGAQNTNMFTQYRLPNQMTLKQLVAILWDHPEFQASMLRHPNVSFPGVYDETPPPGWIRYKDTDNHAVISLFPQPTGQWNWDAANVELHY